MENLFELDQIFDEEQKEAIKAEAVEKAISELNDTYLALLRKDLMDVIDKAEIVWKKIWKNALSEKE
uniref:Uncharacterized protein n=1 Tax=viral metagenome TaxID=1070528 RepID=A0A6M3L3X0_9ZZZZ